MSLCAKCNVMDGHMEYCPEYPGHDGPTDFQKADQAKRQWSLLPMRALEPVVDVLAHGAKKYSVDNWMKCDDIQRYKDALARHFVAYQAGEWDDPDSGLPHLAHLGCNCVFLLWFYVVKGKR